MKRWRLLGARAAIAATLGWLAGCTIAMAQDPGASALYLVGEDWVGRWQDGGVAASTELPGTTIDSIVADRAGGVWLLAWPGAGTNAATADKARITRYAAATLDAAPLDRARLDAATGNVSALWPAAPAGHIVLVRTAPQGIAAATLDAESLGIDGPWRRLPLDAARPRLLAGHWLAPAPLLVGIDSDPAIDPGQLLDARTFAPDAGAPAGLRAPAILLAVSRSAALVLRAPGKVEVVGLDDGKVRSERRIAVRETGQLRGALSPDGGTAIVFVEPPDGGMHWPGVAWAVASGKDLPSDGLFIDDGAERDPPAARSLACLLPDGAGAIFSLIGQPADRSSEAVLFAGAKARRVPLNTGYVQRCVLGEVAKK